MWYRLPSHVGNRLYALRQGCDVYQALAMKAQPTAVVEHPTWPSLRDVMGPGLITGASDDDPSGIATYSQVGAPFGYGLA